MINKNKCLFSTLYIMVDEYIRLTAGTLLSVISLFLELL